jgi:hypothetical protein
MAHGTLDAIILFVSTPCTNGPCVIRSLLFPGQWAIIQRETTQVRILSAICEKERLWVHGVPGAYHS